jgi:diaminohydroxyphosphoribosylaminopyrimidine deaminase / 5-amino-6-(5-phosphoribosylamino)uracil reductase
MNETRVWDLLLALARRARDKRPVVDEVGLRLNERGDLIERDGAEAWIVARPGTPSGWTWPRAGGLRADAAVEALLDLYMPLCVGERSRDLVLGHLAQSLDGRIATVSGASQFITGNENLIHAHRMRALCDVVLVGGRTVREDNPRLTTRLVPGTNPVRVVLDPHRRLGVEYSVFQDGAAPTLLFCTPEAARGAKRHGQAEIVTVEGHERQLPVELILADLRRRGLRRIFIEGGGVTISRFLQARALTRLQLAVAPLVFGSGRPSVSLPVIDDLSEAVAFEWRHFASGRDVLFDCAFAPSPPQNASG